MQNRPSLDKHKWFHRAQRREEVGLRLFCFPYAGGSPTSFDSWSDQLPDFVEVVGVRLPGHDRRLREPSYSDWPALVRDLAQELAPFLDKPFAFFGHSFGARIAYELTRHYEATGMKTLPERIFISGCRSPHEPHRQPMLHTLPSDQFRAQVIAENEQMAEVEYIEEIIQLLEPMLRAEIGMAERWGGPDLPTISVPISAFSGQMDEVDPPEKMTSWKVYTQEDFSFTTFPSGHFFLHSEEEDLLALISRQLITANVPPSYAPGV